MCLCFDLFPVWLGLPISSTQLLHHLHLHGWLVSIKYFGKVCWLQISNFPDGISHKSLKGPLEYQMFKYHY